MFYLCYCDIPFVFSAFFRSFRCCIIYFTLDQDSASFSWALDGDGWLLFLSPRQSARLSGLGFHSDAYIHYSILDRKGSASGGRGIMAALLGLIRSWEVQTLAGQAVVVWIQTR